MRRPPPEHDERYCRTHALVARLFAAYRPSNCDAWMYVAQSWEALAALKARLKQTTAENHRLVTKN